MKGTYTVKSKQTLSNSGVAVLALSIGVLLGAEALAAPATTTPSGAEARSAVFATVGKTVITQHDYDFAYAEASRNRFYHGKPAENELALFQREIGDKLITQALLVNEAKRRKLKPDADWVKQQLERQEQRKAGDPRWQRIRAQVLPRLTRQFEADSLRDQLEKIVRKVPAPREKQLREYYAANPNLFTEPEQVRVSVILLSVDPSSTAETWKQAREFGTGLIKQMREEGASFEELAKKYSGDTQTAAQGGDMGYLHGGMLPGLPEQAVKKLKPGEISDVVNLMEGVAIFKLAERRDAVLSSYDRVQERVGVLWAEAESDRVWKLFVEQLRKKTKVKVDESRYSPLEKPAVNTEGDAPAPVK